MKYFSAISALLFSAAFIFLPLVWGEPKVSVATTQELYVEECGSCHMAYSPTLLVEKSWAKLMHGLDDHFDDNAELDSETQAELEQYIYAQSAEKFRYNPVSQLGRSMLEDKVIIRISELPYFIKEHDEITKKSVVNNPKIQSFSYCNACHSGAEQGDFNEDDVHIPNATIERGLK